MARPAERRWPRIVLGYGLLLVVAAPMTDYAYEWAAPENRPLIVRLAVAALLGIVLIHLRRRFRGDPLWDEASAFEEVLTRPPQAARLDPAFVKWRTDLSHSRRSRSYFEQVLRPRLKALIEARGGNPGGLDTVLPPEPASRRRGTPWRALD